MSDEPTTDMTVEEFITRAKSGRDRVRVDDRTELQGWIAWDGNQPDVVLFSHVPVVCPNVPIPKNKIDRIRLGNTYQCWGSLRQMWLATIYLKPAEGEDGTTLQRLHASTTSL